MTRINPATFFWNEFHTAEIGGIGSCIHDHNADVGSKPGIAGGPNTARFEVLEKLEMRRFPSCSIHQTSKYHHCQEGIAIAGLWTPSLKSFGLQWKSELSYKESDANHCVENAQRWVFAKKWTPFKKTRQIKANGTTNKVVWDCSGKSATYYSSNTRLALVHCSATSCSQAQKLFHTWPAPHVRIYLRCLHS